MKKIITVLLIISFLFVPSFAYAEGGKEMAKIPSVLDSMMKSNAANVKSTRNTRTTAPLANHPESLTPYSNEELIRALNPTIGVTPEEIQQGSSISGTPYIDYQALYDAQLQSRIAELDNIKNTALSELDTSQNNLKDIYYNKRNQAGAQSDVGALNFAQFMASRGISGNAGAMPEIYRNNALQGQIGALNQQEASDNAAIESQRADINSAYQNDVAAARAEMQAQQLQAEIEQQRIDAANALKADELAATAKTTADNEAYSRLQDTKADYANTVNRFSANYQAEIDKVRNDGDPSNDWQIPMLESEQTKQLQSETTLQAAAQKEQDAKQRELVNNALQLFGQLGYLTPEMKKILSDYGLPTNIVTLQKYKAQSGGSPSTPWYLQ
jgi:hypothetical protein